MRVLSLAVAAALFQAATPVQAQQDTHTHVLVVVGVSGEERFEKEFYGAAKQIVDAAHTKYGVPSNQITFLAEHPAMDSARINGVSDSAHIRKAFKKIATDAKPGDLVLVVLIGHGTSQGENASMFAAVGPDLSAVDFDKMLMPLSKQQVAFVDATSASGDFIAKLAGKNRVIATSTMSPMEKNYSKFAKHFGAAFDNDAGDANKDGRVSLLEAYDYARTHVEKDYASKKDLQSEHARLDDNGDGKGTEIAGVTSADGRVAARWYLNGIVPEDPQLSAALKQRDAYRLVLDKTLAQRATADSTTYGRDLEGALTDLVIATLKAQHVAGGGK